MAIANAELRFPLWGAFGGDRFYGPIPVELAVVSDAGIAWGRTNSVQFTEGDHQAVRSVGAAARINLLGFAVARSTTSVRSTVPAAAGCGSSI